MKTIKNRVIPGILAVILAIGMAFTTAAPSFAAEVDNSTTLADGEYTIPESDFSFTGGTGKLKLSLDKLIVKDGKATGEFSTTSTGATHLYYGGEELESADNPAIYNPETQTMGEQVVAFADKKVTIPVVLNTEGKVSIRTTAMSAPHWVNYTYRITKDVTSGEEGEVYTVDNQVKMFSIEDKATLKDHIMTFTMKSASFDKLFVGTKEEAAEAGEEEMIAIDPTTHQFEINLKGIEPTQVLAFHSVSKDEFYNRLFTFDTTAKTVTITDYKSASEILDDIIDPTLSDEEAVQKALSVNSVELVNALIESIQVQYRDENTDRLCAAAKACYDALTDTQKEELDDPDYFGLDTGSVDEDYAITKARNEEPSLEKQILVVSFGTSFNESRSKDILEVEKAIGLAYPEWSVRRAFTAQIIINHIQAREGYQINNVQQALDRAVADGVKELVVQPTHLMHGAEYDELVAELNNYQDKLNIKVAEPLLGQVGNDTTSVNADKSAVANAVVEAAKVPSDTALVLMGHGTSHEASITYDQMQAQMNELGFKNVFVGTVEGNPADTALPEVKKAVEAAGFKKVVLRPLMVVAGDHANNDMAADEEGSWYYGFVNGGEFEVEGADEPVDIGAGFGAENVTCQIEGLGRIPDIQNLYISHLEDVIEYKALEMTNNCGNMFKPASVAVRNLAGGYLVRITFSTSTLTKGYVGSAAEAEKNEDAAIPVQIGEDTGVIDLPVQDLSDPLIVSFYGRSWQSRNLTINLTNGTAVFDPVGIIVDEFEGMSLSEAIAQAEEKTSVELVNKLIEAIQVQKRDKNTDKYCELARVYFDALSEADKASEEAADAVEYFSDEHDSVTPDDPRNQDGIGKKELLVVSFGTSFNDSRVATVKAVEDALAEAYPDYSVRRAFTAQIIINHIQARDGEKIDNMYQAMERAVANDVKELVVVPTHLMSGAEYDELVGVLEEYAGHFKSGIDISAPLLNADIDKSNVAKAAVDAVVKDAGAKSLDELENAKTAIVFMGHGTSHDAQVTYSQMQDVMKNLGYKNVFIGTVEGKPASTALPEVKKAVEAGGYTKVILRPLMVVAGDHANNDMAADEEGSWYYAFVNGGEFEVEGADEPVDIGAGFGKDNVTCQVKGLGEIPTIQQIYVTHVTDAIVAEANKAPENNMDGILPYSGTDLNTTKADGSQFGMFTPQEGATWMNIKGDKVEIHYSPKNKTVYGAFHWGLITDSKLTKDVIFYSNGDFVVTVSTAFLGKMIPIAPIKKSDGKTTADQYYLCIPNVVSADVEMFFSEAGDIAMFGDLINVKDLNDDKKLDVNEAIDAFHFATTGSDDGYEINYEYGWITKFLGVENAAVGYYVNNKAGTSVFNEIKAGDSLNLFTYKDTTEYKDKYAFFAKDNYAAAVGKAVNVKLIRDQYDMMTGANKNVPVEAATFTLYDYKTAMPSKAKFKITPKGKGIFAITVKNAGAYYLVANGNDADDMPLTAAVTIIKVAKGANPMTVKAKTITGKANKNTTFTAKKAFTVKKAQGKVTFKQVTKNKNIKVAKNGRVTVKKGLKKGKTYKIKVKVTAKGNKNYKPGTKTVVLKVKVK